MNTLLNDKMLSLSMKPALHNSFLQTPLTKKAFHTKPLFTHIFTFTFQLLSHNSYVNYNVLSFLIYKISVHLKVTIVTTAILKL